MMSHISPELVRMVGWALLHFVWQGAAIGLLLWLALAMTQRASVRYALAVGALLLMLALPVATLFFMQGSATAIATSAAGDAIPPAVQSGAPGPLTAHHAHAAAMVPQQNQPLQPSETMLWLVRAWMFGVLVFALRGAGGFVVMQRLRRLATTPATDELLALCETMKERMGIARAVRFCRSAALQVPAVVGGIRPVVLLPISALTGLSNAQIEAIVAHELAHIQRLDYFVNLFQVFAETVLFYHPAVWWVNQRIRVERENCCDDTAIAVCGNRLEYVRALTHLESLRITPQFAMAANGSPLKARVRRLLGMAEQSEGVRAGSSLLGGVIIAAVVLAASSLATGAKAQTETKPAEAPQAATAPKPSAAKTAPSARPEVAPAAEAPAPAATAVAPEVSVTAPQAWMSSHESSVYVPPVSVHVPEVNVNVPPVAVHNPYFSMAVPAINVHVPKLDMDMPAMHIQVPSMHVSAMIALAQAAGQQQNLTPPGESYIDGMKAAGMGDISVDELIALKVQGVTPEYVREMKAAGMPSDVDDIVGMKVQGVTPEYVKQLKAAYPGIDADTIIAFKVQGVTTEYASELAKLGIKADTDELVGLKVQGVTPEYIRDMRATGINFDTDELIGMKVQGVTPAYVNALKSANLGKMDADDIIGAKTMGITPEFIEKAKSHNFKDLDLEKLIELKNAGVL